MNQLWQDIRFSLRMMKKNLGFAAVIILSLTLGIGGIVSVFSFINSVLINPLPYKDSEQLMLVFGKSRTDERDYVSYPEFLDWREQNKSFNQLAAVNGQSVNFIGRGEPSRFVGGFVSSDFFNILGVKAANGRTFLSGDDQQGAQRVVVLSHEAWVNRLGSDPKIVGQSLNLNGQLFTVIGVLPHDFAFSWFADEIYMPAQYHPGFSLERDNTILLGVLGRLKPGVTQQQAQAEMNAISTRLARQYPETNKDRGSNILSLKTVATENIQNSIWILFCVTAFVLLIVCSNIANLMFSRASSRQKEIALRISLGASRIRIVCQLLTEMTVLSTIGGGLGLLLGLLLKDLLILITPFELPPGIRIDLDMTLLLFTVGVVFISSVISGLVPALKLSRSDMHVTLKEGGKGSFDSSGSKHVRNSLVVAQIAISLFLLIGAGLMVKSFHNIFTVNPGYNPKNLLTMEYRVPRVKYPEQSQQLGFHRQVLDRVRLVPGVNSATIIGALPHSGNGGRRPYVLTDRSAPPAGQESQAQVNRAEVDYFSTMQIPLIHGRVFSESDKVGTQNVVVINIAMAERYWPGADPIGKTIRFPDDDQMPSAQVVGIVGNIKHHSLDEATADQIYFAYAQRPNIFATLVVRTSGEPMALANSVKKAVWAVDKDQPVWKVRTLEFLLDQGKSARKFMASTLSGFSFLALLLATMGIYGVISYSVNKRTQEIGIRTALGAQRRDILHMILGQGFKLVLIGIGVGLVSAYALTHLITSMLFNVSATDLFTFATVPLLLAVVALLACWIPARRASKVDPMIALRYE